MEEIARRISAFIEDSSKDEFELLALELFKCQVIHNPAYAKLCNGVESVLRWEDTPAVPTVAFKELDVTSLPEWDRKHVFYSSGTTQQIRSRHYHSEASLALYEKSVCRGFGRMDFGPGVFFFLIPMAAQSSLAHMAAMIANEDGRARFFGVLDSDGSWRLDSDLLIKELKEARYPVTLFGTAFLFVSLLEALERTGVRIRLPQESSILETGGYKGRSKEMTKNEFRRALSESLGIPADHIFGEYGMSELSSQAYDRADGLFRFPPWARARMISPATGREVADGERGLIRVYDLANVWSAMAVQTEDVGIKRGDAFELCGRAPQAETRGCSLMTL